MSITYLTFHFKVDAYKTIVPCSIWWPVLVLAKCQKNIWRKENLCSRSSEAVGFGEVSESVSHRPFSVYHLHSSPVSPSSSHRYLQLWKREHSQECCLHSSNVWTSYSALSSQILYSHRGLLLPLVCDYKRNHILFPTLPLCTIYLLDLGCGLLVDWLPSTPMTLSFRGNNTKLHRE